MSENNLVLHNIWYLHMNDDLASQLYSCTPIFFLLTSSLHSLHHSCVLGFLQSANIKWAL